MLWPACSSESMRAGLLLLHRLACARWTASAARSPKSRTSAGRPPAGGPRSAADSTRQPFVRRPEAERNAEARRIAQRLAAARASRAPRAVAPSSQGLTAVPPSGPRAAAQHERADARASYSMTRQRCRRGRPERTGDQTRSAPGSSSRATARLTCRAVAPGRANPGLRGRRRTRRRRSRRERPSGPRPGGPASRRRHAVLRLAALEEPAPGPRQEPPLAARRPAAGTTPASAQRRRVCSLTSSSSAAAATRSQRRRAAAARLSL